MYERMPSITITISTEAHQRLKKLKEGAESFSDVILREVPEKANTFGDLERLMEERPFPEADPKLMKAVREGRGRRSSRSGR
jgi:predicted CopG family antitoxin